LKEGQQEAMSFATSRRAREAESRSLSNVELACLVKAGMTHRDNFRFNEARETFVAIRALCPAEPHAEIGLGTTCFSEGRFEQAIEHYRQALRLNPCNAYAYALLGEAQIFDGDCAAARVSLRRACEIDRTGAYGRLAQRLLILLDSVPEVQSPFEDRPL
jgi:Flp pilus assembly protein TadD